MIGTKLAHYTITAHLGSGGFGDVYQANDSKLGRNVAIKLLPEAFARDSERVARFEHEARVLASLNHPNIAAIYGIDQSGERKFLVMELVPGETLAKRIKRGPIPINETLTIAKQIADALEAAHHSEKEIIHRDLKLANLMITPDGNVKILDFGLAKVFEAQSANMDPSNSPTMMSMAATNAGVILGTAAYMSPEQAKGQKIDRRTDIFAFGAVIYEMLTGRQAFTGDTVGDILAAVIRAEPDWTRLPPGTPQSIQRLLRRSLKKDPRQRLSDIRDARIEIEEAGTETEKPGAPVSARSARPAWIAFAAAALAAAVLAIPAMRHLRETPVPSPPEMRVEINTPPTTASGAFALSPDGSHIVFVAGDAPRQLWLRALDKTDGQLIAGTEGANFPFWSPDNRSIGFFASGKLYRIDIAGGPPQALASAPNPRGGAWNVDGTILFAPGYSLPLFRVAASGSPAMEITRLDAPRQTGHQGPQFLPDGRHFLFYAGGSSEASGIYLGSLDGGDPKRLTAADTTAAYLAPDRLVYIQQGALVVRQLDLARSALTGDPVTLANPADRDSSLGAFSVSTDGRVAYRAVGAGRTVLSWFDRSGKALGGVGEGSGNFDISPDGRRVTMSRTVDGRGDLWLMDLVRGGLTRFTFDGGNNVAIWSPDGKQIAFQSNRNGPYNLYVKPSNGVGADAPLLESPYPETPQDWSKDGRFLLYRESGQALGNLWALEMTGNEKKRQVVVSTPFDERSGEFSPDGRWIAYETNESGRYEIVVQAFPEPVGKWQVSIDGGTEPRWRDDGRELYFVAPDEKLMAVPVAASGSQVEAGTPVSLFQTRMPANSGPNRPRYDVSRDGRFLINTVDDEGTPPITLILNWKPPAK